MVYVRGVSCDHTTNTIWNRDFGLIGLINSNECPQVTTIGPILLLLRGGFVGLLVTIDSNCYNHNKEERKHTSMFVTVTHLKL